ncbi:GNAT family N-acetyltransferase [Aggregatilinea lenta]|uniref:GNAT family N-acetyltransferase n=1 Tax=Aggregatilinea lenta TaxID=913108 RepID=UPI001EE8F969|nr:GNAT family N-acetyltransferase [Aggregatilinea lenta]
MQTVTTTHPDLQIRPASPDDRAAIEAIAAVATYGEERLTHTLDRWYTDAAGEHVVALAGDQVVGAARLSRLGDGEWWIEVLRVAPHHQRQGVARILHHFVLNRVRQIGSGVICFKSSPRTEVVQVVVTETGFEHVASLVSYDAPAAAGAGPRLARLGPDDLPHVMAWLATLPYFEQVPCSFESEWNFLRLTQARVTDWLAAGQVLGWTPGGELQGVAILGAPGDARQRGAGTLRFGYLDAAPAALAYVARAARRWAADSGCERVAVKVVKQPERLLALEDAGFRRRDDREIWLFEREIHLAAHADLDSRRASGEN